MNDLFTAWHAAVVVLLVLAAKVAVDRRRRLPTAPGPPGWPLIGNLLDVPLERSWIVFAQWSEKYGDLIMLNLLGRRLLVVNSLTHACELLEKQSRSVLYSDRPRLIMAGEVVGWDQLLVLSPYGDQFREHRRLMARVLGSRKTVQQFAPVLEKQTGLLLRRLLHDPSDIQGELRQMAGNAVLMIAYGYKAKPRTDPLIKIIEDVSEQAAQVTLPGAYYVDSLPFLRYVPEWMPGAGWKRKGKEYKANMDRMAEIPYQFVKEQMALGKAAFSFTSSMLSKNTSPEAEYSIKMSAAVIYAGGADTTVSAEQSFILAAAFYPAMQKKAQEELDAVVGTDRLPTCADLDSAQLPYLYAFFLEVLRWNPVAPNGIPRAVLEDDYYNGYYIPKGTTILINQWKLLHDPDTYSNPFEFNPDRFLAKDGKEPEFDPRKIAFGFGRRICPGIYLAESSVLMVMAMLLSVYDIANPTTPAGELITADNVKYTAAAVSRPEPFKCTFTPRSEKAKALILAQEDDM
ncbi:cytochrome P450 [Lenzites betulinus]|nr:cytochrome P450 [Lenzites betulinus]